MQLPFYADLSLLTLLVFASIYDLTQRRIPNRLLAVGLLTTVLLHLRFGGQGALLATVLAGFGIGLLMFLPLYLLKAMAAGDVKLMATVGAFTGPALAFEISLATYCLGGLLALAIVLARGQWRAAAANVGALLRPFWMRLTGLPWLHEVRPASSVGGMPYALAISLGTVLMLWIRHS